MKRLVFAIAIAAVLVPWCAYAGTADVYNVSLQGTVNTSTPFQGAGTLLMTSTITTAGTTNGVNPVDVALGLGNPAAYPSPGAILYYTNTYLAGSNSALDLAYVSISSNCVTVQPDTSLLTGLHYSNPSWFTVSSSLATQPYFVLKGTMKLCSNDSWQTFQGTVEFWGSSFASSSSASMPYKATMSGRFVRSQSF
jgi:hypothetical protein